MSFSSTVSRTFRETPRDLYLYLVGVTAVGFTLDGGIYSVLLNLYVLRLGYGPEFVGILNSAGLFVFAALSLPIGAIQRYTNRQLLVFGLLLMILGLGGLPLAELAPVAYRSGLLIGTRIIALSGLAFFFVRSAPFVMQILPSGLHSRGLAWQTASISLAGFLGGIIGGRMPLYFAEILDLPLSSSRPYQIPLFITTCVLVPAVIATWLISEPESGAALPAIESAADDHDDNHDHVGSIWQNFQLLGGLILLVIFVRVLQVAGVGAVNTFSNVYLDDGLGISSARIGAIAAWGRLLGIPISLSVPFLLRKFTDFRLVVVTISGVALLMVPLALVQDWRVAGVLLVVISSIASVRYLAFLVFTLSLVEEKHRPLISGAGELAIGGGFAIMSLAGGFVINWYGYTELFLLGAGVSFAGVIAFVLIFRKRAAVRSE